ncbi:leucine-rich repeat-containing G-protein coupled receptor 4-like isoform X2 [Zootermopsis nevadensis]|uniref:leucine-rich repeat-containing G-protein coupled receptor 4-like isoform X2 n=1 Tax=Zootermopsis nevadensis TaxID=136037 RepID=UPI000B8E5731|nr:leucine-rich repeat-containing G-protein coupled receptor 4-like isoform X2 [Zootermopsis nevadensis]
MQLSYGFVQIQNGSRELSQTTVAMCRLLSWFLALSVALSAGEEHICTYSTSFHMTTADCSGRMFKHVPTTLSSDIKALSATYNRIRGLYKDSFKNYTYLKYLYLDNNMISYIENGTFDPLQQLEVVRLSHNALETVPVGILQLPKLRKLFMDSNRLNGDGGFAVAPVSETLELLSLANCHLEDLPPLGMYPKLSELNISGNELKVLSSHQLAPLCSLHLLDLRENPMLFKNPKDCECQLLATWITQMNIYYAEIPLNCSNETENHTDSKLACMPQLQEVTEMQQTCRTTIVKRKQRESELINCLLITLIVFACIYIAYLVIGTKFKNHSLTEIRLEYQHGDRNRDTSYV